MMKKCTKCGEWKLPNEFNKDKNKPDGLFSWCKNCLKAVRAKYYKEHGKRNREQYRREQGLKSMYENKDCSQYLGIVVGERLCRHLFKDVKVMPPQNPGFDIICNKGKKIDVKTAILNNTKILNKTGKYFRWLFAIRKNKIADYFICVAFDNREDLTPTHMWMIPGDEVNDKTGLSISPSTTYKWSKWERSINDVQLCCTAIRGD